MPIWAFSAGTKMSGAFSDSGIRPVSTQTIVAYAILYNDGDLVFEEDNTPDETDKATVYNWPVEDKDYVSSASEWPWSAAAGAIKKIRFATSYRPKTTAYMFYNCSELTEFDGDNLDMSDAISARYMFYMCSKLKTVKNIADWNMGKIGSASYLFSGCSGLTELDLSHWNFQQKSYVYMDNMFNGCTDLRTVGNIGSWNAAAVSDASSMFYNCTSLESLDFSGWTSPSSMTNMFRNCSALSVLTLGSEFIFPGSNRDGLSGTWYLNGTGSELSDDEVRTRHNAAKTTETYYKYYQNFKAYLYPDGALKIAKDITVLPDEEHPQRTWSLPVSGFSDASSWPWNTDRSGIKAVSFIDLYCPSTAASMFADCVNLASFDGANLDLSLVTDMSGMFSGCTSLLNLTNINGWNTKNVSNMSELFKNCSALKTAEDVKSWNVSHVTTMNGMFENTGLTELNLTGWNTSSVTNMSSMFRNCSALTAVSGMGGWNVSGVTDMSGMFENCAKLHKLDFTSWDTTTSNPSMTKAFSGCTELEGLILGEKFRFGASEDGLGGVWKLNDGNGRQLDAAEVKSLHNKNAKLETYTADKPFYAYIDQSGTLFIHQSKEDATGNLLMRPEPMPTRIDEKSDWPWDAHRDKIRNTDISASYYPPTMAYMFADCVNLGKVAEDAVFQLTLDARYVTDMSHMFEDCASLTSALDLSGLHTENVTSMESMFAGCTGITSLSSMGLRKGNTGSSASTPGTSEASGWDTGKVQSMKNMFKGCTSLTDISVMREWNTGSLKDISGLFESCSALTEMTGVSNWNIGKFENTSNLFNNCSSLAKIDTGAWNNSQHPNENGMFSGCTAVRELVLGANFQLTEEMELPGSWQLDGKGAVLETSAVREKHAEAKKAETYLKPFYGVLYDNGDFVIQRGDAPDKSIQSDMKQVWLIPVDKVEEPIKEEEKEDGDGEESGGEEEPKPADKPWPWKEYAGQIKSVSFAEQFAPFDTANMFDGCTNLTAFHGENFATWNITDMHAMFRGCSRLTLLNVTGWNTSNVTDMSDMFSGCTALQGITGLSSFNTASVTKMDEMFQNCAALVDMDLRSFDSTLLASMTDMFAGCVQLKRIVLGGSFRMLTDSGLSDGWYLDGVGDAMTAEIVRTRHNASRQTESYFTVSGFYAIFYDDDHELVFQIGNTPEPGRTSDKIWKLAEKINGESNVPWNSERTQIESVTFRDKVAPKTTAYWFADCVNLKTVTGSSENLNMQNVTDMRHMFQKCTALSSLDVEKWDTAQVTNVSYAFEGSGLISLNAEFWDLAVCTDASFMFANCPALEDVAADFWNMPKVLNMSNMFCNCPQLYNVDISEWNTVSATDMSNLFKGCARLGTRSQAINLKAIHTDSVTDLSSAFEGTGFSSIDLSECNTAKVKKFSRVFANCKNLKVLDIGSWDTGAANTMDDLFSGLDQLESLTLGEKFVFLNHKTYGLTSHWKRLSDGHVVEIDHLVQSTGSDIAGVWVLMTDAYALLYQDGSLVIQIGDEADTDKGEVKVWLLSENVSSSSEWPWNDCRGDIHSVRFADPVSLNTTSWMFGDCDALTSFDGTNLDVGAVKDMSFMFYNCPLLTELKGLGGWDVSQVITMNSMFWLCAALADVSGIRDWNVSSVADMSSMFQESGLVSADLSRWETDSLTDVSYLFSECAYLRSVDLTGWNTSNVTNMSGLFNEDTALQIITGLPEWNTLSVKDMSWMFYRCANLTTAEFGDWATSEVTDMTFMFAESGITSAELGEWNMGSMTVMEGMFSGCASLKSVDMSQWNTSSVAAAENGMLDMFYGTTALETIVLGANFRFAGAGGEGLTGGWMRKEVDSAAIPYNRLMKTYDGSTMSGTYTREQVYGILYNDGDLVIQYGNQAAEEKTKSKEYLIEEIDGYESWPWYGQEDDIKSVSFKDTIHFDYLGYMFYGCDTLESFDGTNLDTSDVYYASGMFLDCSALETVSGLDGWDTSTFIETDEMFSGCAALTGVDGISKWDTGWLELTANMFADSGVRALDLSGWTLSGAIDISAMFARCTDLETLDLSGLCFGEETKTTDLFADCTALGKLVLGADFRPGTGDPALTGQWRYLSGSGVDDQSGADLWSRYDGAHPGAYVEIGHLSFGVAVLHADGTLEFCATAPAGESGIVESVKLGSTDTVTLDALTQKAQVKAVRFDEDFASAGVVLPWENIAGLFANLTALETVDFSGADLSGVTDMSRLFQGCTALTTVTGLRSGKLTALDEMFSGCKAIRTLDISGLATADPASMKNMFADCTPASLTLGPDFHGQSGTGLTGNYKFNSELSASPQSGENLIANYTGNKPGTYVRDDSMNFGYVSLDSDGNLVFRAKPEKPDGAVKAEYLQINDGTFNAATLSQLMAAFVEDDKATVVTVSFEEGYDRVPGFCPWNSLYQLFKDFSALQRVSFLHADLSKVTNVGQNTGNTSSNANSAFAGCLQLESVDFTGCDLSGCTDKCNMFNIGTSSKLESVILKDCTFGKSNMKYAFKNAKQLKSVDFTGCDLSEVTAIDNMFRDCAALTSVTIDSGLPAATTAQNMFNGCKALESVDIGDDLSKLTDAWAMFQNCAALTDVAPFKLSAVTDTSSMFQGCASLKEIDVSLYRTSNVINMSSMFSGCVSLVRLDLSGFDMSAVGNAQNMFSGCTKLATLKFGEKSGIPKYTMTPMWPGLPSTVLPDTGGLTGKWKRESDGKLFDADNCEFNEPTESGTTAGTYHKQGVMGSLIVSAEVSEGGDRSKDWQFRITLTGYDPNTSNGTLSESYGDMTFKNGVSAQFALIAGGSKTITGIPAGLTYKVEELNANADGYTADSAEMTGIIETNTEMTAAFLNHKEAVPASNLTVSNTVRGSMGDKSKAFRFTLSLRDDTGPYLADILYKGNDGSAVILHSEQGNYTFTLTHGQTVTFVGLPGGLRYTVTETEEDGYTVEKTNDLGTIDGKDIAVDFVNTKDKRIPTAAHTTTVLLLLPIAGAGLFLLWRKKRGDLKD